MNHSQFTELLEKHFPVEYQIVGTTRVTDMIKGNLEFDSAEGGNYIDPTLALAILSTGIAIIQTVLQVISIMREREKAEPTLQAVIIEVSKVHALEENEELLKLISEVYTVQKHNNS